MSRLNAVVFISCIMSAILFADVSIAHQPRIVYGQDIVHIQNPSVSQAFYARLNGSPDFYRIDSDVPFRLFVSVLVPDIEDVDKDVSFEVSEADKDRMLLIFRADGSDYNWTRYFEEFGGDYYFSGPEVSEDVDGGTYFIKVFSADNDGKYVLVVGIEEEFPLSEIIKTLIVLPRLKSDFFGKSPLSAYLNLTGVFLLIFVVMIAGISFFVLRVFRKSEKKALA